MTAYTAVYTTISTQLSPPGLNTAVCAGSTAVHLDSQDSDNNKVSDHKEQPCGNIDLNGDQIAGVIHTKKHGKLTHGMMELTLGIGAILQVPVLDGMQEEVGATTVTTNILKDITQQRVLHDRTST